MKKSNVESLQLAECIGDVRALLIDILCDNISPQNEGKCSECQLSIKCKYLRGKFSLTGYELAAEILDECHTTFLSCYNTFYPTTTLKWNSLCDLLQKKDKVNSLINLIEIKTIG